MRLLDERLLAYWTLTTPTRHLWISYPIANEESQTLLPSPWIGKLRKRFPGIPVQAVAAEPQSEQPEKEQLAYATHPRRAVTHLLNRLRG